MTRAATLGWASATAAVSVAYWVAGVWPTVPTPLHAVSDDLVHAMAYALLGCLAAVTAYAWPVSRPLWLGTCYAVGHGAVLELLQWFAPPRVAEASDLLADAGGAAGGVLVAWLLVGRRP